MPGPKAAPESSPETAAADTASFGYWVRRRRLALDLTQADLARAVSCATITIAKIERDERRPSRQMAGLLAVHLAVPPDARAVFLAAALGEAPVDRLALDDRPLPPAALPATPSVTLTTTSTAAPPSPPSSMPTPATPFVGRRPELARLAATLAEPSCRLLTLLGAGGFGKTRLAIRLGELSLAQPDSFPDGVFFVPLDGLGGSELVIPAIAAALAFIFYAEEGQEQQLLRYLAPKQLLLILDNAEGILDADLVLRLLAAAPQAKLLVTSRATLNLQQEWLYPIGGLTTGAEKDSGAAGTQLRGARAVIDTAADITALAGADATSNTVIDIEYDINSVATATADTTAGALSSSSVGAAFDIESDINADAVVLFRQSALRVQPTFDLQAELEHVQQICRLVEGAPLAIELAAAWLKALPCAQVAHELAHGIDLLETSMRDVPLRHRSMRAVLAQSWAHLSADEQQVFQALSVFEGGFRLEAAQAVIGPIAAAPHAVLGALVEKAMLQLAPGGRYRIHALLRGLGAEHLGAAPPALMGGVMTGLPACLDRHAAYYLSFLAARRAALGGPGQMASLREIEEEMDNIRSAWSHAAAPGELFLQREALEALFGFLWMRGRYAEGEQMARQALEGGTSPIALTAYAAQFAGAVGAYDRALPAAQSALDAARGSSDAVDVTPNQAFCHYVLGLIQAYHQDQAAIPNLRAAYDMYRAQDNASGAAEAGLQLGFYLWAWEGDHERASALVEESLARYRALGDAYGLADALNNAAVLRWYAGDVDGAERLYRESLETAQAVGNRLVALQAIGGLAFVALARGQWEVAIDLGQERLALAQRLGHANQVQQSLSFLAPCYISAERFTEAAAILDGLPEVWHTAAAPLAYIGIGAYDRALAYLHRATAEQIAAGADEPFMSILLVGWAALLQSDCTLFTARDPSSPHPLAPGERHELTLAVLVAAQKSAPADPLTHAQAARLLAREHAKASGDAAPNPPVRPVRELAGEVLALELG